MNDTIDSVIDIRLLCQIISACSLS